MELASWLSGALLLWLSVSEGPTWVATDASQTREPSVEPNWDYEPRNWLPDLELEVGSFDEAEQPPVELSAESKAKFVESVKMEPEGVGHAGGPKEEWLVRQRANFWTRFGPDGDSLEELAEFEREASTKRRRAVRGGHQEWRNSSAGDKQRQDGRSQWERQAAQKCTQFRVDIRETVICDKKRCDKFDFQWPKYDNQIVHIQTSRQGMRFHRAEYAFAQGRLGPPAGVVHERAQEVAHPLEQQVAGRSRENTRLPSVRVREQVLQSQQQLEANERLKPVKFDLFDLFKPKSSPKPSSVGPQSTPETSTSSPVITALPSTEATTGGPSSEAPKSQPEGGAPGGEGDAEEEAQDTNSTRLVTSLRVDTARRRQSIIGFGGALSDSACRNVKSLSSEMAQSLMEDYFGERGLKYNLVRMSMGSSDFSATPYTNNDQETPSSTTIGQELLRRAPPEQAKLPRGSTVGENDDIEMAKFRLVDEDFEFKLPLARQAMATSRGQLKFFASLWSPPIWMKNNSNIVHGHLKGDVYGPYYKALADYMVKWLEAYRKQGIDFWATTGLNEPITGAKPFIFHNSLAISRADYVTFIKLYLGPMLRQRSLGHVKLIILDDNKGYAPRFVAQVLDEPEAAKYVSGVGVHWYMNDEYENLNFLAKKYPNQFLLSTEACNGYLPFQVHTLPGDWDRGVAYLLDIIKVLQKGAAGWVDWNMVLNRGGGPSWAKNYLDAPVIVNAQRDEYYKSPSFYAIGHLSKFVEPDSVRLEQRLANARYNQPLEAVAFYTPKNYIVIVALNANKHPVPFRIIVDNKLIRIVKLREDSFNTIIFKWKSNA